MLWYAVMSSETDDWGFGSLDLKEAKQMAKDEEDPDTYIAVIDTDGDPICIADIFQNEFDNYGNEFDETTYNVCLMYRG